MQNSDEENLLASISVVSKLVRNEESIGCITAD